MTFELLKISYNLINIYFLQFFFPILILQWFPLHFLICLQSPDAQILVSLGLNGYSRAMEFYIWSQTFLRRDSLIILQGPNSESSL